MLREKAQHYYVDLERSCSESILMAANEVYDLGLTDDEILLFAGFRGGMGCGSTCGCLAGAVAALGKLYADKEQIKEVAAAYAAIFKDALKKDTWDCAILHDAYFAEGFRCFGCVEQSAKTLEAFIAEKGM